MFAWNRQASIARTDSAYNKISKKQDIGIDIHMPPPTD
jgi:hypothetical protein